MNTPQTSAAKSLDEDRIVEQFTTQRLPFSTLAEEYGVAPSTIVSILERRAPSEMAAYWDGHGVVATPAAPHPETSNYELITPAAATAMLAHNIHNRSLSEVVIRRYIADIQAGRWKRNGSTIVFGRSGALLDGQHRLHAIARAGVAVDALIVRNADDASFDTIDSGRSRSLSDIVGLMGVANAKVASPAARMAYAYASGGSVAATPPRIAVTEFVGLNHGLSHAVAAVNVPGLQFPRAALAAVLFLASPLEVHPKAKEFVEGLATGIGLKEGDARIALRDWEVLERKRGRGQIIQATAFTAAARAWNVFAQGKQVRRVLAMKSANRETLPIYGYRPENVLGATLIGTVGRHGARDPQGNFAPRDASQPAVELPVPEAMQSVSPAMQEAIQAYVETDMSIADLANKYDVKRHALSNLLRDAGLSRKGGGARSGGLDHGEVIALYATGDYSYETLGDKLGADRSAIYYILKHKAPHLMRGLGPKKKAA